jgi:aspartyl-tRNA(Asn)/glutamyl-tRNA(Gln) amidotransferase subunit C
MDFTPEQLDKLATLARLDLVPEEREKFAGQISAVLKYVDTLSQAPVEGVEPLEHVAPISNIWREDVAQPCPAPVREAAVRSFPEREGDLLKVKAVFK